MLQVLGVNPVVYLDSIVQLCMTRHIDMCFCIHTVYIYSLTFHPHTFHTCTHAHARTYTYTHMLAHTHTHVRTHKLIHTHTRTHTYTLTHARTHTHTHTHTQEPEKPSEESPGDSSKLPPWQKELKARKVSDMHT